MNAIAALLLLLLVPFSGQSQTLEQLDASCPPIGGLKAVTTWTGCG